MKPNSIIRYVFFLACIIAFASCSKDETLIPEIELSSTDFFYKSTEVGTKNLTLTANTDWTATLTEEGKSGLPNWLTLSQGSGGSGTVELKIRTTTLNKTKVKRTAKIEFRVGELLLKSVTVEQKGVATVSITTKVITMHEAESAEIKFSVDDKWELFPDALPWADFSQTSGEAGDHTIVITPKTVNDAVDDRVVFISINSDGVSEAFNVIQKTVLEFHNDGDVVLLKTASEGVGIDLIFIGDGFSRRELAKGEGKYEQAMRQALEHFFSVEPYITYKEYFNAYMVVAESEESGISNQTQTVKTKFSTTYEGGTRLTCNQALCQTYTKMAMQFKGKPDTNLGILTTVLVINSTTYAGTCWWYNNGFSVAICPMSTRAYPYSFKAVVNHEAGGHGFGMLADEYVSSGNHCCPVKFEGLGKGRVVYH